MTRLLISDLRRLWARRITRYFPMVLAATMLLAIFLIGLLYVLTVVVDGSTDGITGELWANAAVVVGRTGLACGLFCVFGVAVTLVVNSSVGSITGFVIYWFIVESFLVSSFLPRVAAWLPVTNAAAFASGRPVGVD